MNLTLAFDDNLGYPDGLIEGIEQTVSDATDEPVTCSTLSFHELDQMIESFTRGDSQLMFLPCGCFPYVATPLKVMAQATTGPDRVTTLTSILVARSSLKAESVPSVSGLRFGCINKFCTTSYWAPQFLERNSNVSTDALRHPVWVDGFDDLVVSLIDGRSDVAMVWEPYLAKHASESAAFDELGRLADLPAPVLIADPSLGGALLEALGGLSPLLGSNDSLFNGLASPNVDAIKAFFANVGAVQPELATAKALW